jgi:hypothetical protein
MLSAALSLALVSVPQLAAGRDEQAVPETHRTVPRGRAMRRLEWRLVAGGEVGTVVLQRALAEDANPFGVGALATHSNLERPIIGAMMQS